MHCWHHLSLKEIQLICFGWFFVVVCLFACLVVWVGWGFFCQFQTWFYFEQSAGCVSAYIDFSFSSRTNITCTLGMPTHCPTTLVILYKDPDKVGLFSGYAKMKKYLRILKGCGGRYQPSVSSEVSLGDLQKKMFINGVTNVPLQPNWTHTSPRYFQCPSLTEQLDIACTVYICLSVDVA